MSGRIRYVRNKGDIDSGKYRVNISLIFVIANELYCRGGSSLLNINRIIRSAVTILRRLEKFMVVVRRTQVGATSFFLLFCFSWDIINKLICEMIDLFSWLTRNC